MNQEDAYKRRFFDEKEEHRPGVNELFSLSLCLSLCSNLHLTPSPHSPPPLSALPRFPPRGRNLWRRSDGGRGGGRGGFVPQRAISYEPRWASEEVKEEEVKKEEEGSPWQRTPYALEQSNFIFFFTACRFALLSHSNHKFTFFSLRDPFLISDVFRPFFYSIRTTPYFL